MLLYLQDLTELMNLCYLLDLTESMNFVLLYLHLTEQFTFTESISLNVLKSRLAERFP